MVGSVYIFGSLPGYFCICIFYFASRVLDQDNFIYKVSFQSPSSVTLAEVNIMSNEKLEATATKVHISFSDVEKEPKPKTQKEDQLIAADEKEDYSKTSEPFLKEKHESATPLSPLSDFASTTLSPSKSEFSRTSIDEEKVILASSRPPLPLISSPTDISQAQALSPNREPSSLTPRELKNKKRQRILDLSQRVTALILSIIILAVMTKAYVTYRANQNVTAGGLSIYPTFMQLWPTYLMITTGAVTVLLNACVVAWRVRGTMRDLEREEMYNKVWDYVLHGITVRFSLSLSTKFEV